MKMVNFVKNLKCFRSLCNAVQAPVCWLFHFWPLKTEDLVRDLPEFCNQVTAGLQSQWYKLNTLSQRLVEGPERMEHELYTNCFV